MKNVLSNATYLRYWFWYGICFRALILNKIFSDADISILNAKVKWDKEYHLKGYAYEMTYYFENVLCNQFLSTYLPLYLHLNINANIASTSPESLIFSALHRLNNEKKKSIKKPFRRPGEMLRKERKKKIIHLISF